MMAPCHILVVDDDPKVRTLLRRCFEGEGFVVSEAKDGPELRTQVERHPIGLITLDLNLGKENGLDLAREIRKEQNVPIIMLTGKGDAIDRVVGLELGADDYLAKPFELRELLARVRAVLRRSTPTDQPTPPSQRFSFEGWVFDVSRRSLTGEAGEALELTTAEFNLLEAFVRRPHRVLSRDDIMDLLKGQDWSPLDRSIDNLIARLRKKIEPDADHPRLIKTVRGVGYTFAADDPISITEDTPLDEIVHLMETRRIKRVPIVRDRKVVGIVSRANPLHALASLAGESQSAQPDDRFIREQILSAFDKLPWAARDFVNVLVKDGIVDLWGSYMAHQQDKAMIVAAENVSGVRLVRCHLSRVDPVSGLTIYNPDED